MSDQLKAALEAAGVISEDGKPVSKYAAKKARKKAEAAVEPAAQGPVTNAPAPAPAAGVMIEAFFGDLEASLLGDKQAALDEMVEMRNKGFSLIDQSKTFNLREAEYRAKKDAWNWKNDQIKEAQRIIFNELRGRGEKSPALIKAFTDLQDAYHQPGGDVFKAAKFEELCVNYINSNPRMKELHEKNLKRAEEAMAHFKAQVEEQERLYREGVELLELANVIADENGWPRTEPKAKGGGK